MKLLTKNSIAFRGFTCVQQRYAFPVPHSPFRIRPGFTLIELLLVIAIMAVLSTMSLALMRSATEDAKAAATESRISKIESMLQLQMENYEVRRLPISRQKLAAAATGPPGTRLVQMQNLHYRIIADIINAEMPRPFELGPNSYVAVSNVNGSVQSHSVEIGDYPTDTNRPVAERLPTTMMLATVTPASVKRWSAIKNRTSPTGKLYNSVGGFDLPAEYLYEILLTLDFDGIGGVESLGSSSIGDSDDDGILEIVDAWGNPMDFKIQQLEAISSGGPTYTDGTTFVPLSTEAPRSLEKIRFVVRSSNLPVYDDTL